MENREIDLLVQRYLEDDLNPDEFKAFEEELREKDDLRDELEFARQVDEALSDVEVLDLRDELEEIHLNVEKEEELKRKSRRATLYRRWYFPGAASIIILLALGLLYLQGRKLSPEDLYAKYFEPYEPTMIYRSNVTDTERLMQEAQQLYAEEQYDQAIVLFNQLIQRDAGNMASHLYSGISYMELDEFEKADDRFHTIIRHHDNLYLDQAEWYLGFCYLMTGRSDMAREHFEMIEQSSSYYNKMAGMVLGRMK